MDAKTSPYRPCLLRIFNAAVEAGLIRCLYTVHRIDGIALGHFDSTVEIREAISDFIATRSQIDPEKQPKLALRMDLLIYCHATEITATYQILCNLLRHIGGQPYLMQPFPPDKKYPKQKIEYLCELCKKVGEEELPKIFEEIFDHHLRNAFSHSDYCITEDEFRIGHHGQDLAKVKNTLEKGINFYQTFFDVLDSFLHAMRNNMNKFYLMPQHHEILELLTNDKYGCFGFSVHISSGSKCTFYRLPEEVYGMNIMFERDGDLSLQVGDLSLLSKTYRINGEAVKDLNQLLSIKCRDINDDVSFKTLKGSYPISN